MTLASVSNSTQTASAATSSSLTTSAANASVNKDEFLKLLVAQMSNQDPTQPQEGTEFVTQLAQFSLVESSQNQSTQLANLSTQLTGMSANQATDLIGQTVGVKGAGMTWDGLSATPTTVNLSANAAKVSVQVQDASGNTVRTMQMGAEPGGPLTINWDGKDDSGQPAPKGTYSVKVSASSATGDMVNASSNVSGKVTSVSFAKGYPEVTLDSGVTASISDLVSVGVSGGTSK